MYLHASMGSERLPSNDYTRGFTDALEYVLGIYNRLESKLKPEDKCAKCKFICEIGQLASLAKDKQFEQIESELGYFLR